MSFDERLMQYIDETPVPDALSPENIANMLRSAKATVPARQAKVAVVTASVGSPNHSAPSSRRNAMFKMIAAAAACLVMITGLAVHYRDSLPVSLFQSKPAVEVRTPENYEAIFASLKAAPTKESSPPVTLPDTTVGETAGTGITPSSSGKDTNPTVMEDPLTIASMRTFAKSAGLVVLDETGATSLHGLSDASSQTSADQTPDILRVKDSVFYYIAQGKLSIVRAEKGSMELLSVTEQEDVTPLEMYIDSDRLVVLSARTYQEAYVPVEPDTTTQAATSHFSSFISSSMTTTADTGEGSASVTTAAGTDGATAVADGTSSTDAASASTPSEAADGSGLTSESTPQTTTPSAEAVQSYRTCTEILVTIYDITDPAVPQLSRTYTQDGSYLSSRFTDGILYLVTSYGYLMPAEETDLSKYVPSYAIDGEEHLLSVSDISVPKQIEHHRYSVLAGLDIRAESPLVSIKAMLGYNGPAYFTGSDLYITGLSKKGDKNYTTIAAYTFSGGSLTPVSTGYVAGTLIGSSGVFKSNGSLYLLTTQMNKEDVTKSYSSLYVLDDMLKETGKLTKLVSGASIESARFEEGKLYILPVGEEDSIIAIDLTNPKKPVELSDLKINGYSTYLHPYQDGLLLGFGRDIAPDGTTGIQLVMFRTEAGGKVTPLHTVSLHETEVDADSPALEDYRALYISGEQNLIGVPSEYFDGIANCSQYFLFSYDETEGFVRQGVIEYFDAEENFAFQRGIYADGILYIVSQGRMVSVQTDPLKVISTLSLLATH